MPAPPESRGPAAAIETILTAEVNRYFRQNGAAPPTMYAVVRSEVVDGKLTVRVDYEEDMRLARHMVMHIEHDERLRLRNGLPLSDEPGTWRGSRTP